MENESLLREIEKGQIGIENLKKVKLSRLSF